MVLPFLLVWCYKARRQGTDMAAAPRIPADTIPTVPVPASRSFNFTAWSSVYPTKPAPGDKFDIEFNDKMRAINQTMARLGLIQRDDGALANASVGIDQLQPGMLGIDVEPGELPAPPGIGYSLLSSADAAYAWSIVQDFIAQFLTAATIEDAKAALGILEPGFEFTGMVPVVAGPALLGAAPKTPDLGPYEFHTAMLLSKQGQCFSANQSRIADVAPPTQPDDAGNKSYIDAADTAAMAYTDAGDATTLTTAKQYADNKDATVLAQAKAYTDQTEVGNKLIAVIDVANKVFVDVTWTGFAAFHMNFEHVLPTVDQSKLSVLASKDGGATWLTTNIYSFTVRGSDSKKGGDEKAWGSAVAKGQLSGLTGISNSIMPGVTGAIDVAGLTNYPVLRAELGYSDALAEFIGVTAQVTIADLAINGIRFDFNGGFKSGKVEVYGVAGEVVGKAS